MALFWFLAGILTTLATLIVLLPWLRTIPRLGALPAVPWPAPIGAGLIVAAVLAFYLWFGHAERAAQPASLATPNAAGTTSAFANAVSLSGNLESPAPKSAAGSMGGAIAALEARLAKGGGTADDWELLAKSFEFLGRPADASKARARQLPPLPSDADESVSAPAAKQSTSAVGSGAAVSSPAVSGTSVSGEVSLSAALRGKANAGSTLFIIAKSVDSPGAPVAVYRGSVAAWPVKFTLDDSQSMLPGRNLSSARRVTIEARISQSGQPLPAAGDLQGSTGVINPADHQSLKILIDRVIT